MEESLQILFGIDSELLCKAEITDVSESGNTEEANDPGRDPGKFF